MKDILNSLGLEAVNAGTWFGAEASDDLLRGLDPHRGLDGDRLR